MNELASEAWRLRQQDKLLSTELFDAYSVFVMRGSKPRLPNDITSRIIAMPIFDGVSGPDAIIRLGIGPKVCDRLIDAGRAYDANDTAAQKHYSENAGFYHELAIEEAAAQGVQIHFKGDIATIIKLKSLEVIPSHPVANLSEI